MLPDLTKPASYGPHCPPTLCSYEYPEHMQGKADEKNARARQRASGGSGGKMVKVIPSTESLLAKLWHAALLCPSGEPAEVKVDPDLSRATWPRCSGARTGTPAYDDHYVDLWSGRFREYVRRERELRGPRDVNTLIEADDPYWEQYRELIAEYRELLLQNHTPWDRFMNPQELYAEVAALYVPPGT